MHTFSFIFSVTFPRGKHFHRSEPARVEIKTCVIVVEKNLPISIADDMVKLIKSLFPGNETLQQVTLGKQKSTNEIRQVLGFYSTKACLEKLKKTKFSLIIDKTTDCSTTTQ